MIDINKLTLGEIKQISCLVGSVDEGTNPFWVTGKKYFIRTVTMHLVGELKFINSKDIVLSDASWVADSGRFHTALKTGKLNEVELFTGDVNINRESIVDATEWTHKLPRDQK